MHFALSLLSELDLSGNALGDEGVLELCLELLDNQQASVLQVGLASQVDRGRLLGRRQQQWCEAVKWGLAVRTRTPAHHLSQPSSRHGIGAPTY